MIARCARARLARAYALIDVLMVVVVVGIVAVMALPSLRPDDPLKLIGAATLLVSDIEYAQSLTITDPADPTVVVIDAPGRRYWLARTSAPTVPIERPSSGGLYEVVMGEGIAGPLGGVQIRLVGTKSGSGQVRFDGFGRLTTTMDARVRLSNTVGAMLVTVAASTGSVSVEGE